ncbi:MAG TPA: PHP domain-containing protein [Gaiellaceae bacterium]|nr:PHP domain-containing protein [Gaiellaceae bacterium]
MDDPTNPANEVIADQLDRLAALLELAESSPHSVGAYRRAATLVRDTPLSVAELVRRGEAQKLRGIGPSIEKRLQELVETGELGDVAELEDRLRPGLVGLGRYLGVSPRLAAEIGRTLRVTDLDDLRGAAAAGRLREVPGIGPAKERQIIAALAGDLRPQVGGRAPMLSRAWALLERIAGGVSGVVAGDVRRWRDEPRELAVVTWAPDPTELLDRFAALPEIVSVVDRGERLSVGVTVDGLPVELVVAEPGSFGTALVRATGSRAYVDALEPLPVAAEEEGVYAALGIPWCPPELRERPFRGEPPPLVALEQIRGDLHCHSVWSDGRATIREMGEAAIALGYEYLAICDHTQAVNAVPGLDAEGVRWQAEEVAEANELLAPFRLLHGIECDILADGSLDLPDEVLAGLDWVMASVHAGQRMPRAEMTKRVLTAMAHPAVSALSHPTGRLIGRRPPNELDIEVVVAAAVETGVALEVNGLPARLDLKDEHVRLAVEAGADIVCSTDAHSVRGLGNMPMSVATARRGWAPPERVVNTRPLGELLARRGRRRT